MSAPAYFDYFATTPLDPIVKEAMLPYLDHQTLFANSHSPHQDGHTISEIIQQAKQTIVDTLDGQASGLLFTSGATESIHLALTGAALAYQRHGKHILTTPIEHSAVNEALSKLKQLGFEVEVLPLGKTGLIELDRLKASLRPDTLLMQLGYVNNEVGLVQPVAQIAELLNQQGILLHVDAAQAVGRVPLELETWGVDFCSLSAHKAYGPKGIGALYIRQQPKRRIQSFWSKRQDQLRPGTPPTHQIVGMAAAYQLAAANRHTEYHRLTTFNQQIQAVCDDHPHLTVYQSPHTLPHCIRILCDLAQKETLVHQLSDQCSVGSGAACQSSQQGASPVLRALGLSYQQASGSLRVSLGRFTTQAEVARLCNCLRTL